MQVGDRNQVIFETDGDIDVMAADLKAGRWYEFSYETMGDPARVELKDPLGTVLTNRTSTGEWRIEPLEADTRLQLSLIEIRSGEFSSSSHSLLISQLPDDHLDVRSNNPNLLELGTRLNGKIERFGDIDYIGFETVVGAYYALQLSPRSEVGGDFVKTGESDEPLFVQDEGVSGWRALQGGLQYVKVESGRSAADYSVTVSVNDNHGNSPATATHTATRRS